MRFTELVLLAIGLSMDAFAVSVCKGLAMEKLSWRHMAVAGLWFGGFQALMPLLGYVLGSSFERYIISFDHWIAFVLLTFIGINMIRESCGPEEKADPSLGIKTMFVLAVATSIDALAVGVTFAFLDVDLLRAVTVIGLTTFLFSAAGMKVGNIFGTRYKTKAEMAGGVILILLGLKILLEHLGLLSF